MKPFKKSVSRSTIGDTFCDLLFVTSVYYPFMGRRVYLSYTRNGKHVEPFVSFSPRQVRALIRSLSRHAGLKGGRA